MPSQAGYISNLTPLRGLAALLVAIFHFEMAIARFIPASKTMFFEKCYLMVDLFFIMSGFIMLHVYDQEFKKSISKGPWWKFMVARFARIYPLHLFTLLLLIALVILFSPPGSYPNPMENGPAIVTNIFLLQSFYIHNIYTWNIPSWSISAEWTAYLLFPLLVWSLSQKRRLSLIIFVVFVLTAYLSMMYLLPRKNPLYPSIPVPHNVNTTYDYGFLRGLAGFVTGMLMGLLYQRIRIRHIIGKDGWALLAVALLILAMHKAVNDGYCIILFAMIVLCFACNKGYLHALCNHPVLQYLGLISYSVYLMQIFLQEPFSKGLRLHGTTGFGRGRQNIDFSSGLLYCGLYLALLIGLSSVTFFAIENPCRKFINKKWGDGKKHPVMAPEMLSGHHEA